MASENVIRDPQAILDAEATVRGVGASGFNTRREFLDAPHFDQHSGGFLRGENRPVASAFSVPLVSLKQLRPFRSEPEKPRRDGPVSPRRNPPEC